MSQIHFFVAGDPKAQPRIRAFAFNGHARVYDPGTSEGWKSLIAVAARGHFPEEPYLGEVTINMDFRFRRPKSHYRTGRFSRELRDRAPDHHVGKPDVDNLSKAVLDCLTELGVWRDDCQVVRMMVTKRYDSNPGVEIIVCLGAKVAVS